MAKKNYELLGRTWDWDIPVRKAIQYIRQEETRLAPYSECNTMSHRIALKLFFPALYHLGFGSITTKEVRKEVEDGVKLAVQYFDDSWWRPEQMKKYRLSKEAMASMAQSNRLGLDKSNPKRELHWFEAFKSGLFLGGLVGRWNDLSKIGAWFDATIEPEYQAGQLEDEYMQLFVCIAGSLSLQPMAGGEKLLAKVKKCRTKRPRLLCVAWEAANVGDQPAFDKAFPETVKQFLSKPRAGDLEHGLAIDQSSIWFIAEHRGLKFPPLSEKERAAVVTRDSAGLAD